MKTLLHFFLLMCGVFYAETDEVKSVMEGESVTLNPDLSKIQGFIEILWRFGDKGSTIAQIDGNKTSYEDYEAFRGRLQLDQTGSLTITDVRTNHSGLYKAEINHKAGTSDQKFSVTVYESPSVIAGGKAETKSVSVTEGDPVTLHVPQPTGDELIVWRFGDEGKLIAKHDIEAKSSPLYDTDERFRDRLKLDRQTGSLIITNTRTTDSGLYTAKISSKKQTSYNRFILTVSAVPDSGLSRGVVAGIGVVVVLLVAAAAVAAGVMYYRRPRTSNLPNQTLSALEGDPVILNPDPKIQTADEIQWLFGDEETLIAEIKGENREITTYRGPDMIFMNRLKLDKTTGSLTIKVIAIKHNGLYTLKIRRGRKTFYNRFSVYVREREIEVMEGDSVTLKPATEIQTADEIQWLFGAEETLIAKIKGETREMTTYDGPDGIFRNRLKLNKTTGSLTITNTRTEHAGYYTLKIRRGRETLYTRLYVYVRETEIEVMEGDPVTLKPATEIQTADEIQWLFRDENLETYMIAEIKVETGETYDDPDEIFTDRLKLDKETGSLTITNTTNEHAGLYTLIIRRGRETLYTRLFVYVRERVAVMNGDPVILKPNNDIVTEEKIQWLFGDEEQETLIAELTGQNGEICTYDVADGGFKNRLELDKTTGSLTIKNSRTEHSGLYKLEITSSSGVSYQTFIVIVKDCTENQENESVTVEMPLLNGEYVHVVNEQVGMNSL